MEMESLRIVILGAGGVRKSELALRFVRNKFMEWYDPTVEGKELTGQFLKARFLSQGD